MRQREFEDQLKFKWALAVAFVFGLGSVLFQFREYFDGDNEISAILASTVPIAFAWAFGAFVVTCLTDNLIATRFNLREIYELQKKNKSYVELNFATGTTFSSLLDVEQEELRTATINAIAGLHSEISSTSQSVAFPSEYLSLSVYRNLCTS